MSSKGKASSSDPIRPNNRDALKMKFNRKLIVRNMQQGSVTIPKPVLDAWDNVETVEMLFDEENKTLVICPVQPQ
jgi:hypothetical protein